MKKILFIITKSENGGAQKWTKEQIDICSDYFDCFLATNKKGWLTDCASAKDIFINSLIENRFSFTYLLHLNKFININQIDLIIASSANAGIYARLLKILNKKLTIIYVSHGWSSIYNGGKLTSLYTFIERQLSKLSDSILCISKKDYDNAHKIIKIKKSKLKCITNKIYPVKIKKQRVDNKIKILSVARLVPPKRIDLLIKALENISVELHIIGDGILKRYLSSISNKKVFFHGNIDNFSDFSSYDIFALISDSEGLPLSALEAMSVGLPIVLSNVGGCNELVFNNGYLVNNDIEDIRKKLIKCINNKDLFSIRI